MHIKHDLLVGLERYCTKNVKKLIALLLWKLIFINYFYHLIGILERYKLTYHFDETVHESQNNQTDFEIQDRISGASSKVVDKYLLHDKRLNQLWTQAKQSGFTSNIINY